MFLHLMETKFELCQVRFIGLVNLRVGEVVKATTSKVDLSFILFISESTTHTGHVKRCVIV